MQISDRAASFQESVIREMTRLHAIHGGVNLAQGFPDFDPPQEILEAACKALRDGYNQYAITWGTPRLREAIARHATEFNRIPTHPAENVTVACGATEAMIATLMAVCNPGDEVIIFTPYYENYGPDCVLSGAKPVYVRLYPPDHGLGTGGQLPQDAHGSSLSRGARGKGAGERPNPPSAAAADPVGSAYASRITHHGANALRTTTHECSWCFDPEELAAAFGERTRAIIVNTPHNPTGKVFTREELELIAGLCLEHNCLAITDEIYEHILYDGREHLSIASLDGMLERTITISGASKTFSVTGWRLGWAVAPKELSVGIRRVHDFLTVGAPHPLQEAAAVALSLPETYYQELAGKYAARRDRVTQMATAVGLTPFVPEGAYYTLTDISAFGYPDDVSFTMHLIREVGVAVVPGSSFYPAGWPDGKRLIRFAFPKREETLDEAELRLRKLQAV